MKKIIPALATLFFILPSVSFAAGLTSQQADSLIAVVKSSPSTPASAFVSLITSFSNITVNQATNLIAVVQSSPSTPANAFVNLLISFTTDTVTTQLTTNQAVTPVSSTPTPPPNTTLCNGTYYTACVSGSLVCPSSGGKAYCQNPQDTQALQQLDQQLQTLYARLQSDKDNVSVLRSQWNSQCSSTVAPLSAETGRAYILALSQAQQCSSLSQSEMPYIQDEAITQQLIITVEAARQRYVQ